MLVLTRKLGEAVLIGGVRVIVCRIHGEQVRLGIEAPRDVPIVREELGARLADDLPVTDTEKG